MPLANLIFLHGFLGAKEDWTQVCDALDGAMRCITIDLPGHTDEAPITPHYLQELQDKIQSSLPPEVSVEKESILVGYSMGGRLCLELSLQYGYEHLILLSTHPGISDETQRRARVEKDHVWIEKLRTLNFDTFLEEWYAQPLFESLKKRPELREQIIKTRSKQDPKRMADVLSLLTLGRMPACSSFPRRTLFLYGENDEKYKALSLKLPSQVKVEQVKGCGHILHLEDPSACAKYILEDVVQ